MFYTKKRGSEKKGIVGMSTGSYGYYDGYISIPTGIKPQAARAAERLGNWGGSRLGMLSGNKDFMAAEGLLPENGTA